MSSLKLQNKYRINEIILICSGKSSWILLKTKL